MTFLRLFAPFLPALLLLAGCGSPADQSAGGAVALVKTAKVVRGDIDEKITLYGAVENGSVGQFTLASPVEAVVSAIDIPVGNQVSRGQVIVRLSPSPTSRLDYANAVAGASAADAAYARARRLRGDGLVSDADVETTRTTKQSADALRASLASRGAMLVLKAPVSGTVEIVGASTGALVAAGAPIVTIVKDGDLRARFGIDPALARRIPDASSIDVTAAGSAASFTVPVISVDNVVDPQTKLASVYVRIPGNSELGSGESLTGRILLRRIGGGIAIPYAALLDDGGQPFVYVIEKGQAKRRDIAVGPKMGDRISVSSGLKTGELVAIDGVTALEDGMKVRTK